MQSKLKKILVFGPALSDWSEIRYIAESFAFLDKDYDLFFVDPLSDLTESLSLNEFMTNWKNKICQYTMKYDAFFGFSLGGVIMQQCFDMLGDKCKSIVLFSTPSFADEVIHNRLGKIIHLINEESILDALHLLEEYVYYPYDLPKIKNILNINQAGFRLGKGLQYVLDVDSRPTLSCSKTKYLHLIGSESQLVNINNVIAGELSQLIVVPNAGMRVLQNNLEYCMEPIINFLKSN